MNVCVTWQLEYVQYFKRLQPAWSRLLLHCPSANSIYRLLSHHELAPFADTLLWYGVLIPLGTDLGSYYFSIISWPPVQLLNYSVHANSAQNFFSRFVIYRVALSNIYVEKCVLQKPPHPHKLTVEFIYATMSIFAHVPQTCFAYTPKIHCRCNQTLQVLPWCNLNCQNDPNAENASFVSSSTTANFEICPSKRLCDSYAAADRLATSNILEASILKCAASVTRFWSNMLRVMA